MSLPTTSSAGPWHVGPNGLDIREADETPIVSLPTSEYQTRVTQEANARLIAMTPDLLTALQSANKFILAIPSEQFLKLQAQESYDHQMILSVIAKALPFNIEDLPF